MDRDLNMKISVCVPVYNMPNGDVFLKRCLNSLEEQTFKDFEVVVTQDGKWAENHNSGIKKAKGEYIKFLHMDDYLADKNSLAVLAEFNLSGWLITGCSNNPNPYWTNDIWQGNNKLGGPSCLMIKNDNPLLFDESLTWMVDCDYYMRLYERYGSPFILSGVHVNIGIHDNQATNLIPDKIKIKEQEMLYEKYSSAEANNR